MKRIIIIFFTINLIFFLNAQTSQKYIDKFSELDKTSKPGNQYLFLIAIDKYANRLPIKNHVNSIELLKKTLISNYYIDKVFELYDYNASKENIEKVFKKLQIDLKKEDSLLIVFSGRGYSDKDTKTGYWIPFDGGLNEDLKENWISSIDIKNYLAMIYSQHICLISNSCYSTESIDQIENKIDKIDVNYYKKAFSGKSRKILLSGLTDTQIDEVEFINKIKNVLKDNKNPYLTSMILYNKIEAKMTESAPLFGDIKNTGYDKDSDYVLFLREDDPIKPEAEQKIVVNDQKTNDTVVMNTIDSTSDSNSGKIKIVYRKDTEAEIQKKYFKILFSPSKLNRAAVIVLPFGSVITLAGLSVLIFDIAAYFPFVTSLKNRTDIDYSDYSSAYNNNLNLFCNGIVWTAIGLGIMSISLTLRLYALKQEKKITLNFDVNNNIELSICYKFL